MKSMFWKVEVVFIGFMVGLAEFVYYSDSANVCDLKYKKEVKEKPNLFIMTNNVPGVCSVEQDKGTFVNHHQEHKYIEHIVPETVIGGLNYDARTDTILYWSKIANVDHSRLYRVRLNDSDWESVLDQDDDFRDMSYDWITKNLYVIMGVRNLMVAVNVEKRWNPTVVLHDRSQLISLAVHPNKGYLFFVEASYSHGLQHRIYRAHLDGSGVLGFNRTAKEARHYISSVAVDFFTDRLYWSVPATDKIQHSSLDGRDVRTVRGVGVYSGHPDMTSKLLAPDSRYVYYRSADRNSVRRIEKASGAKDGDFELSGVADAHINEIVPMSQKIQRARLDHPCKPSRGGCEKYCFAVPLAGEPATLGRVCKCSYNEAVAADGASCARLRRGIGRR